MSVKVSSSEYDRVGAQLGAKFWICKSNVRATLTALDYPPPVSLDQFQSGWCSSILHLIQVASLASQSTKMPKRCKIKGCVAQAAFLVF